MSAEGIIAFMESQPVTPDDDPQDIDVDKYEEGIVNISSGREDDITHNPGNSPIVRMVIKSYKRSYNDVMDASARVSQEISQAVKEPARKIRKLEEGRVSSMTWLTEDLISTDDSSPAGVRPKSGHPFSTDFAASLVARLIVPDTLSGAIIGPKGRTANRIGKTCGVFLHVGQKDQEQISYPNLLADQLVGRVISICPTGSTKSDVPQAIFMTISSVFSQDNIDHATGKGHVFYGKEDKQLAIGILVPANRSHAISSLSLRVADKGEWIEDHLSGEVFDNANVSSLEEEHFVANKLYTRGSCCLFRTTDPNYPNDIVCYITGFLKDDIIEAAEFIFRLQTSSSRTPSIAPPGSAPKAIAQSIAESIARAPWRSDSQSATGAVVVPPIAGMPGSSSTGSPLDLGSARVVFPLPKVVLPPPKVAAKMVPPPRPKRIAHSTSEAETLSMVKLCKMVMPLQTKLSTKSKSSTTTKPKSKGVKKLITKVTPKGSVGTWISKLALNPGKKSAAFKDKVRFVIPLGTNCALVATVLRKLELRQQAYPFDDCRLPPSLTAHLFETDFKDLCNKSMFVKIKDTKQASLHKGYGPFISEYTKGTSDIMYPHRSYGSGGEEVVHYFDH